MDDLHRERGLCGRVRTGVRVARGGRGERTLPLDYGSPGCRDGAVLGALDGRSPRLCVTEQQTIQPRSPRFHDRLRGRHLLHQLLAAFGEQPAQSVFGVVARAVPSMQVAGSRVRSGQLRLGLVLWDIDAAGGTDLWRKHSQGCTAPCDDLERSPMSRGIGLACGLACAGHRCRHPRLGGSRPHRIPPARKNVWKC